MNILVVDDQPNGARVTSYAIRAEGHGCFVAHTLAEAEAALARESVDALFLDLNLRGENGLDLLARLKTAGRHLPVLDLLARLKTAGRHLPVVLFSASDPDDLDEAGRAHGAVAQLAKPYTLAELRRILSQLSRGQHPPAARV